MGKHIFLIHGRDFKPDEKTLHKLWIDTIEAGIKRDYTQDELQKFRDIKTSFIYYGDLSNDFLDSRGYPYNKEQNTLHRKETLAKLISYPKEAFSKQTYKRLPFINPYKKILANLTSRLFTLLGLSKMIVQSIAPDMEHYWNQETAYGSDLRWLLTKKLRPALEDKDEILLVAHSLGTMIAYDVLWKFSHYAEYGHIKDQKISKFISLGSPLGDELIKENLKGSSIKGMRRHPTNISSWVNVAAEDDFVAHDSRIDSDFKHLKIKDRFIYNLAVLNKSSTPHHSTGYLIHPAVIEEIVAWL